jgi:hypothetical protein
MDAGTVSGSGTFAATSIKDGETLILLQLYKFKLVHGFVLTILTESQSLSN